jgi:hypothetical protein
MDIIENYEGKRSIVGSGSDMPIDMLLRKQEVTCMYESPTQVEDFHRSTLKDLTCDRPLFESDLPRGGVDELGNAFGNNYSAEALSLRDSGHRNPQGADPYLPDGTFLDWQGLEQDPRGTATGPDMKNYTSQQFARGKFILQYPDNDDSVPESGINPYDMNRNIRGGQEIFKKYYQNFETSKDNWHNGGAAPGYAMSVKEKTCNGQEVKDPSQLDNRNRMDVTNNLSNDTSIGWRRTTDHRFNVAKYGKVYSGKSLTDEDWYRNRGTSGIDHDVQVSWQDNNMSKGIALKMMDLAKQKQDAHYTGLHGISYGIGRYARGTKHKLTPADMAGVKYRETKETRTDDAHSSIEGMQCNKSGEVILQHDEMKINKCVVKTSIFEKIAQSNRIVTKQQKDDLRNKIASSVKKTEIHAENKNKINKKYNPDSNTLWGSIDNVIKGKSQEIVNYKKMIDQTQGSKKNKVSKINSKSESYTQNQKRIKLNKKQTHKGDVLNTSNYGKEGVFTRNIGGMGNKINTRTRHERSGDSNEINDAVMRR